MINTPSETQAPEGQARMDLLEIGAFRHIPSSAWEGRSVYAHLPALERLLLTDEQAPRLLDSIVHRSLAARSTGLVEVLGICAVQNPGIKTIIQQVAPGLRGDRVERVELTRNGDVPGVEPDLDVITREAPERQKA